MQLEMVGKKTVLVLIFHATTLGAQLQIIKISVRCRRKHKTTIIERNQKVSSDAISFGIPCEMLKIFDKMVAKFGYSLAFFPNKNMTATTGM